MFYDYLLWSIEKLSSISLSFSLLSLSFPPPLSLLLFCFLLLLHLLVLILLLLHLLLLSSSVLWLSSVPNKPLYIFLYLGPHLKCSLFPSLPSLSILHPVFQVCMSCLSPMWFTVECRWYPRAHMTNSYQNGHMCW